MPFSGERLQSVRENLNLNKAEAARKMHTTAMAYGRYESGERIPSYQTIQYMAEVFETSYDYLCGTVDESSPDRIVIKKKENPELYCIVQILKNADENTKSRLLAYARKLLKQENPETTVTFQ